MSLVLKELNRDVIFQPYYSLTISKGVLFQMDNPPVHKSVHGRIQREGRVSGPPPPLKNHKNLVCFSNTGTEPLKN